MNFDYFISTDVFVYIGDLSDVLRLIKSRNKAGGKLAFTTEDHDGEDFLNNLGGIRIQKSTSKVYVKNLAINCAILKPKPSAKKKINISGCLYLLDF